MGYFQHQPHQYVNKEGQVKGATITYFEKIANKMGYEVEWVGPLPLIRLYAYFEKGKEIDGVAHILKILDFEKYLYFGDKHYHLAQPIIAVTKENKLDKITSIEQIKGYRLWYLTVHSPSPFIRDNISHLQMWLVAPGKAMWRQSLKTLMAGRVDAIHDLNTFSIPYVAKKMNIDHQIKTLLLPEPPEPVYVGFCKNSPRGKLLLEKYNKAQAELKFDHDDYEKLIQIEFDMLSKDTN